MRGSAMIATVLGCSGICAAAGLTGIVRDVSGKKGVTDAGVIVLMITSGGRA